MTPRRGSIEVIGVVKGVAGLMPEKPHHRLRPYVDSCSLTNERDKAGVSKIERDADDRDLIGAPPVIRQIRRGFEGDPCGFQFPVEMENTGVKRGLRKRERELIDLR